MKIARFSPSRLESIAFVLLCLTRFTLPAAGQVSMEAAYVGTIPESAPKYWLESLVHEDQSSSRLLVFQTVPGVDYFVESSKDLVSWTEIGSYSGGGEQVVVPMVQIQAPPAPQPPPLTPLPPVTYVWMMMQKATAGGIVIYWHSFDPVKRRILFQSHHFPALTLDSAWEEYFVYVRKFGSHAFAITHPRSLSVAPPDTEHSADDLAMLEVFEDNFLTMDAEVHDHVAAVRYIPPPAPPADNSGRGFFRIRADWSVDSDGDTVPDWEEFAMMAGVAGVGEDGTFAMNGTQSEMASPFDADANKNGVPDGEELDFDDDLIPRSEDAEPKDRVIAWRKARPTRYALFDVPLGTYTNGYPVWPVGVNSQGMVLFEDGVYYGDTFRDLPYAQDMIYGRAHAINDAGMIIGHATFLPGTSWQPGQAFWPSPTGEPGLVADGVMHASNTEDMAAGGLSFGSAFGNDGSFVANTYERVEAGGDYHYEFCDTEVWKCNQNGSFSRTEGGTLSRFCKTADIHWGTNTSGHQILTATDGGGDIGQNGYDKYNVVDGREAVLSGGIAGSLFRVKNSWKQSPTLGRVKDISDTGIAVVHKAPAAAKIPQGLGFWTNSKFLHLQTIVPDLPQTFKTWSKVAIRGMANRGHIVLTMDAGTPQDPSYCAVGYPCAIEDSTVDSMRLAYRDSDKDTVPFTGVDDVSITADEPDPSANNKIWIMAPIGSEAAGNDLKVRIPASADNPLTLSATNMDGTKTITAEETPVSVKGTGNATSDENLILKLSTNTALNAPVGIKSMKRRKVYVTVTPVGLEKENGSVSYPKRLPAKERMAKYLNKTYQFQMNAEIVLTYSDPVPLKFSTMTQTYLNLDPNNPENEKLKSYLPNIDGGTFDYVLNAPGGEQEAFAALRDTTADINVYFVGGIATIVGWHLDETSAEGYKTWSVGMANGISNRDTNSTWVSDTRFDVFPFDDDPPEVKDNYERLHMRTAAHEMGHIIIKYGHPDEGGGAAILPGTDHNERLMRSGGSKAVLRGNRLVKGEWDAAEEWFKNRPNGDR